MNDFETVRDNMGGLREAVTEAERQEDRDALAALDRIEAEVERLTAALEQIAAIMPHPFGLNAGEMRDAARAALAKAKEEA